MPEWQKGEKRLYISFLINKIIKYYLSKMKYTIASLLSATQAFKLKEYP
jgi:hypothetical protein